MLAIWPLLALLLCLGPAQAAPLKPAMPNLLMELGHPFKSDLPELRELGIIRVLTEYSHTYFFIHHGQPYGLDYTLLEEYQRALNHHRPKNLPPLAMVFIPVPFGKVMPLLEAGYGDLAAAGITITKERSRHLVFTRPYLTGVDEVVVAHRSVKELTSLDALAGRQVLVGKGSSYVASLKKLNADLASRGLKPVEVVTAPDLLTDEDILDLVNAGVTPLTVIDSPVAQMWAQVMPNIKVHGDLVLRKGGSMGWLLRPDTPQLMASLNRFLKTHRQGTLTGNVLFKRYFQHNQWLKNPNEYEERSRFSRFAPLFQKYGRQYGFDWLLLAAQAFQESHLNPSRISGAGAVGLMQVMPTTHGDRRAEIKRLLQPEYNVRAGVSYLARLRDRNFCDPSISNQARSRFSLAAYNAGPAAITRVRRASPRLGYDPNRWFFNCEYGALRLVSSEPVHYVRNVLKYYVSYQLSMRVQEGARQQTEDLLHK